MIDPTLTTIRLAAEVLHVPCTLRVYEDEGEVLVELVDVHGRATNLHATEATYYGALALIRYALGERRKQEQGGRVCKTSEKLCETLILSIERAKRTRKPPVVIGDFPRGR